MNRSVTKTMFLKNGAVKTSGGSTQLADGQFAIVDTKISNANGAPVLGSLIGKPKGDKRFAFQVGAFGVDSSGRSFSNKNLSSGTFSLKEIKKLRKSVPQRTEVSYDEWIIGYDGFDATKSLSFKKNSAYWNISLKLFNGAIQYRGGLENQEIITESIHLPKCNHLNDCEECDECAAVPCRDIVYEAVNRLRNRQVTGGSKVSDYVEITPILGGCENEPENQTTAYNYWTLSVCDTGDQEALAAVAAQYNVPVIRKDRVGSTSVYQILLSENASDPTDYTQRIASLLKGCADCPEDYTATPEGKLYAITIEDNGVDKSSVITASLASSKYVSGTIRKNGNNAGVGNYTAIFNANITEAEVLTFTGTATDARNTATVNFVDDVAAFCSNSDTTTVDWVQGTSCDVVEETYAIVLPNNSCNETRLAELQAAYPDLTIAVDTNPELRSRTATLLSGKETVTITLTGSSGSAYLNIDGIGYTATYASNLTTTAANFVTTYTSDLALLGITVTASGAALTFTGPLDVFDGTNIVSASGNLNGSLGTVTTVTPSGTANFSIGGTNYLVTYATSLTATADAFVTSHAATLLADKDVTVTANAGVLTFEGPTTTIAGITITNASGNITATLGTTTQNVPYIVNCSTQYFTTVVSNMVCDACSDVFKDFYLTTAPRPYATIQWKKTSDDVNPNGEDCLCGIKFKSKYFALSSNEYLRDMVAFEESATQIEVSSGYPDEIREGIGVLPTSVDAKTLVSQYVPRTHLYGNARTAEDESRSFFKGTNYHPNVLTRILLGEEAAVSDNMKQYISYYVEVAHNTSSGGFGDTHTQNVEYEFRVELGKHQNLEALLLDLAGQAGVEGF